MDLLMPFISIIDSDPDIEMHGGNTIDDRVMEIDSMDDDENEVDIQLLPSSTPSITSGQLSRGSSRAFEHATRTHKTMGRGQAPPRTFSGAYNYQQDASSSSSLGLTSLMDWTPGATASEQSGSPGQTANDWYPLEPSEDRPFKVMYVPDPTREMQRNEAGINVSWTKRTISYAQFEAIKCLTIAYHREGENKNGVRVLITEWVRILY